MIAESKTADALIGSSGFVGGSLLRQRSFEHLYRSNNIDEIATHQFDVVVCAAAPAQKWIANREPEADRAKIESLQTSLRSVQCRRFVLISTVDVFGSPVGVDETTVVDTNRLHPYGLHRRMLEEFVEESFPDSMIVRLPGLVGPGLRKNVVYDLFNDNNLAAIDSRAILQFYPMVNLWNDILQAERAGLRLIHLTAEPISVSEIASLGFGRLFENFLSSMPPAYDMRSIYADVFSGKAGYQYSRRETLLAIRAYAQSEPPARAGLTDSTK